MRKRLRIFAGPNGSGKSTIIEEIRNTVLKSGKMLDFGIYINADDLCKSLKTNNISFTEFKLTANIEEIIEHANSSGLINDNFPLNRFVECVNLTNNKLHINDKIAQQKEDHPYERISQIIADFLRNSLVDHCEKLSFETVFSHRSKIDYMKRAKDSGYKIYLYIVSTEDPEINVHRVKNIRVHQKGHDVPENKIRSRYERTMNLLCNAIDYCDRAYFYDNSSNGEKSNNFATYSIDSIKKVIWEIDEEIKPIWFNSYFDKHLKNIT